MPVDNALSYKQCSILSCLKVSSFVKSRQFYRSEYILIEDPCKMNFPSLQI